MESIGTEEVEGALFINNEIKRYLLETVKFAKFLLIVGYIAVGILLFVAIYFIICPSILTMFYSSDISTTGYVYLFIVCLNYYPLSYSHKFCKQIKKGLNSNNEEQVTRGFKNLKSYCKFTAKSVRIFVILWAVMVFGILFSGFSSFF